MNAIEQRRAAAIEMVAAGDGLRTAARAGRATRAHSRRLHAAEAAWDALSARPGGRS
uniref:hypothetical protein n=1 Tax=Actinoplanes sp. CA-151224 TaxID=3239904 RepID=UPI003F496381